MSQPLGKNMQVVLESGANAARKTNTWSIRTNGDAWLLGVVRWKNGWRRYVLAPTPQTEFDAECLSLIAAFLVEQTDRQRTLAAERRAATSARNR